MYLLVSIIHLLLKLNTIMYRLMAKVFWHSNKKQRKNNDYATSNLLDYDYFLKHYKLIAVDSTRQIKLEKLDLRQQINFIAKIERNERATMFFIIEKSEEATFNF